MREASKLGNSRVRVLVSSFMEFVFMEESEKDSFKEQSLTSKSYSFVKLDRSVFSST